MPADIHEQITKYLTDAHSIEEQALAQLRTAPDIARDPEFARMLREHLGETEGHERRVRALLEARGASTSKAKDALMKAGGKGFVLFARSQTDTTGKLAAHALSYEALEWASYDLLARTADAAGETDVAEEARAIREEERAMMERIEGVFDRTVSAALAEVVTDDLQGHLHRYLADAHAIEAQSIQLLESGKEMVDDAPELAALMAEHLAESREQQDALEERLGARGEASSVLKDAAMRLGALNWGMFFQAHPDTPGKLAAFAYAFEHLEIGGYEQLRRVAERAGDQETVAVARRILAEERKAAERIRGVFGAALGASLAEQARA
ncbi:MAG: ferritin-like domain-containing protein [Gemmatimonadetes bacterium]|nr:ferritin-like domain-containing protein [Gemmatimonadota bacterium]